MTLPMVLTVGRIGLAPILFLLFQLAGRGNHWLLVGVWALFIIIELSDLLDGYFARRWNQESELGKVLDPLADTLCRLTYFIALAGAGILPLWMLLVFVYRDFMVAYMRVLISREGVMLAARISGKLKAWTYAIAAGGGFLVFTLRSLGWLSGWLSGFQWLSLGLFIAAVCVAVWSFADYAVFFVKNFRKAS
ncbi:MAG TPA: CDP-diacylglycerol--glycerol-3-phosphate 3-phosphatidyltransferase [Spirochaetia bacterium]|nr:CDP-diacylglycerol--glycerol-3-phosphate 3-phosphatidyltransferase [Spirochaetia bacterium]